MKTKLKQGVYGFPDGGRMSYLGINFVKGNAFDVFMSCPEENESLRTVCYVSHGEYTIDMKRKAIEPTGGVDRRVLSSREADELIENIVVPAERRQDGW